MAVFDEGDVCIMCLLLTRSFGERLKGRKGLVILFLRVILGFGFEGFITAAR